MAFATMTKTMKLLAIVSIPILSPLIYAFECNFKRSQRRYTTNLQVAKPSEPNHRGTRRREFLRNVAATGSGFFLASFTILPSSPAEAGEVGARITKAVTTSDLGIAVRKEVVKGAQIFDQIDGQWERFSDRFSLGSERSKAGQKPKPKVIPEPLPLDIPFAQRLLELSDETFCSVSGIPMTALSATMRKVAVQVQPSFERSGLQLNNENPLLFSNGPQFNFVCYVHFKAYSDLMMSENKITFGPFKSKFELQVGERMQELLLPGFQRPTLDKSLPMEESRKLWAQMTLRAVDQICSLLPSKGLVSAMERSAIDDDQLEDWSEDVTDLSFSVAIDGDITLQSQILLQEQGFRLYPNFSRFGIYSLLQDPGLQVSAMDYYFDTDYNSDPDKFEVKEVLLNIVVES